jgi:hypothetical protein
VHEYGHLLLQALEKVDAVDEQRALARGHATGK